jgi:methylated-DNA-[protein]-cysteine S-methyltransferase
LAKKLQNPLAIRAIAATNGKNKILIAIPCHRVIGSKGDLVGYAGGLWRKQWLLDHEAKMTGIGQASIF